MSSGRAPAARTAWEHYALGRSLLGAPPERRTPYLLRPHQAGDMGWVVLQHGEIYWREYGFTDAFEALGADLRIVMCSMPSSR